VIEPTGIVLECGGDDSLLLHWQTLVINAAGPGRPMSLRRSPAFRAAALPAQSSRQR
jgi:hypothetical protein